VWEGEGNHTKTVAESDANANANAFPLFRRAAAPSFSFLTSTNGLPPTPTIVDCPPRIDRFEIPWPAGPIPPAAAAAAAAVEDQEEEAS